MSISGSEWNISSPLCKSGDLVCLFCREEPFVSLTSFSTTVLGPIRIWFKAAAGSCTRQDSCTEFACFEAALSEDSADIRAPCLL